MSLLAADISSHNPITSWPAFLGSVDIIIVKATQGTGYVWSGAAAALAQARAAGKLIGAYHFYGGGDPVAEANYFLAHYDWRPGEVPILDWEPTSPPADPDGIAAVFGQRILDQLGVPPIIYMNSSTARSVTWARTRALGEALWVAQYGANNGQPGAAPAVGSWGSYAEWQYTSAGTRPGVSGLIDLSQFYGDAAAWRAYGTPGGSTVALTNADIGLLLNYPAYYLGPSVSQVLKNLDQAMQAVTRDGQQIPLRQEIADTKTAALAIQATLGGLTPAAIAAAIGQLPAAEAQQIADLVLAGIAAKMNTAP